MRSPNDNYSPPLNGLSRGNKLNQVLSAISNADLIYDSEYQAADEDTEPIIFGLVDLGEILDGEDTEDLMGILICNWWHQPMEEDWWEYQYIEIDLDEIDTDEMEEGSVIQSTYTCRWAQEVNDLVDGLTYFSENGEWVNDDDGGEAEPFSTELESPRPLTRAIIDTHLPQQIRSHHED